MNVYLGDSPAEMWEKYQQGCRRSKALRLRGNECHHLDAHAVVQRLRFRNTGTSVDVDGTQVYVYVHTYCHQCGAVGVANAAGTTWGGTYYECALEEGANLGWGTHGNADRYRRIEIMSSGPGVSWSEVTRLVRSAIKPVLA